MKKKIDESIKKIKLIKPGQAIFLILFLAITVMSIVFYAEIFGENSIFAQNPTLTGNEFVDALWQKVPAVVKTIQILALTQLASLIIRTIIRKAKKRNNRGITISRMLESLVKWIFLIVTVLLILGAWGVDTTTLIASAGVVTLVVGLGAQSLVADIVAGLFIVVEGDFEVGDIVIINGWRGTVKEIGIRTTKLVDASGDVNIVNNSEITTVINQSQNNSLAQVNVGIAYDQPLDKVEKVIEENLPIIAQKIPAIIDGPFYRGVSKLGESTVELVFFADCLETNRFQVQRDMNKEIKLLFDANGIEIAFPQVVVHQAKENSKKK